MYENSDVKSYFNKFRQCVFKLLQVDVKIQDEDK